MKRLAPLILFLAALSLISGYLMSKVSWIGRIGMNLFYKQYEFLKIWWQGALVVFITLLVLVIIQLLVQKRLPKNSARVAHIIALIAAIFGLYATYHDFRHDTSHHLLGERFHLGAYLFWFGWMAICLFYLFQRRSPTITGSDKMAAADHQIP